MKFSSIDGILAVAEAGSIRGGSRTLGITQPSMTRSIRESENELGVPLFTRHGHGITPTEAGHVVIRRAGAIRIELARMNEEMRQAKMRIAGDVSIAMANALTILLAPVIAKEFESRSLNARLSMIESLFHPIENKVRQGEIDFFVGPMSETHSKTSLIIEKLYDERLVILARRDHPLRGAQRLSDLRSARWVSPPFADRRNAGGFDAMFERAGMPPPKIALEPQSACATLVAVTRSDLLAVVPSIWLGYAPAREQLVSINVPELFALPPICIVRRSELPLSPLAERLCDVVRKAGLNHGRAKTGAAPSTVLNAGPESSLRSCV